MALVDASASQNRNVEHPPYIPRQPRRKTPRKSSKRSRDLASPEFHLQKFEPLSVSWEAEVANDIITNSENCEPTMSTPKTSAKTNGGVLARHDVVPVSTAKPMPSETVDESLLDSILISSDDEDWGEEEGGELEELGAIVKEVCGGGASPVLSVASTDVLSLGGGEVDERLEVDEEETKGGNVAEEFAMVSFEKGEVNWWSVLVEDVFGVLRESWVENQAKWSRQTFRIAFWSVVCAFGLSLWNRMDGVEVVEEVGGWERESARVFVGGGGGVKMQELGMLVAGPIETDFVHQGASYAVWTDIRWLPPLHPRFSRLCLTATSAVRDANAIEHAVHCLSPEETKTLTAQQSISWSTGPMTGKQSSPTTALPGFFSLHHLQPGTTYIITAAVMDSRGKKHTRTVAIAADAPPGLRMQLPQNSAETTIPSSQIEIRFQGQQQDFEALQRKIEHQAAADLLKKM